MTSIIDRLERLKAIAPGCYTERDGGDWYALSPDHQRLGEDFRHRETAQAFILFLAGEPLPEDWHCRPIARATATYAELDCGQGYDATIWLSEVARAFPAAMPRITALAEGAIA